MKPVWHVSHSARWPYTCPSFVKVRAVGSFGSVTSNQALGGTSGATVIAYSPLWMSHPERVPHQRQHLVHRLRVPRSKFIGRGGRLLEGRDEGRWQVGAARLLERS